MFKKITLLFLIAGFSNAFSQTLHFTDKADMEIARSGSAAATNGIYEYIANGFSATNGYTSEVVRYNFGNNSWSALDTSVPTVGKRYGNAEIVNGKLYLFNGKLSTGANNNLLEIIDLATGNLTYGAENPFPVSGGGSAVNGTDIYFFGGNLTRAFYSKFLYKYNTLTNQWTRLADMDKAMEITGKAVNNKLFTFGGFNEFEHNYENFEAVETVGSLALTDWINVAETGTKLYQGKFFGTNKYAQITAFDSNVATQEASNVAWLISPAYTKPATTVMNNTFLSFDTKDGYNNGATLQAYIITNWTGDIMTSSKTLLPGRIASGTVTGYAEYFTNSGAIILDAFPDTFRIAYKYVGGYAPLANTTYQIDNVRLYTAYTSPLIERYDMATNTWSQMITELPQPISANALAVNGNDVFICGDYYEQSFLGAYDTQSNTFTVITPDHLFGRRHHNAEFHDNSLYLFGGNNTESTSSVVNSTQAANIETLHLDAFASNGGLKFYPNPVNNILYFNGQLEKLSVYTLDGRKLEVPQFDSSLDLSRLNAGIYVFYGQNNGKTFTTKIIKK